MQEMERLMATLDNGVYKAVTILISIHFHAIHCFEIIRVLQFILFE